MKISDFRLERTATAVRATARVSWEDAPRTPFDLHFETDAGGPGRDDIAPEPEPFVTACFLPAIHFGERRVLVEGTLCPRLAEGVRTAADLLRSWYGPPRRPIEVEASEGLRAVVPRQPLRSAFFFTGGIDSSHLLHANRADYPLDHPASFADAISLHGNLRPEPEDSWNERALSLLAATAKARNLNLIPVRTNLWHFAPDLELVRKESLSAGLAAAALLFRRRFSSVSIASGLDIAAEIPRGTHPLLDPLYSTSAVEIRHDPLRLSRFERLRAMASNGGAAFAENLIVCLAFPSAPHVNCGECEKCVRTMCQLLALGCLSSVRTFRHRDITAEMIRAIGIAPVEAPYWAGVSASLAERGRTDLVGAIEANLDEMRRIQRWKSDAGWKGRLRRLDRRFLGGKLLELRKRLE